MINWQILPSVVSLAAFVPYSLFVINIITRFALNKHWNCCIIFPSKLSTIDVCNLYGNWFPSESIESVATELIITTFISAKITFIIETISIDNPLIIPTIFIDRFVANS